MVVILAGCARNAEQAKSPAAIPCGLVREARRESDPSERLALLVDASARAMAVGEAGQPAYSQAMQCLLRMVETGQLKPGARYAVRGADGKSWTLQIGGKSRDERAFSYFTDFERSVPNRRSLERGSQWPGWGFPTVGHRNVTSANRADDPFAPPTGYHLPATVFLDFEGSKATLRLLDTYKINSFQSGGKDWKIAGDIATPTNLTFRSRRNPILASIGFLLMTDRFNFPNQLIFTEPYDKRRTPVVLVHGLLSTPMMWGNLVRSLEADPEIRRRYQFWVFFYPTGWPIPLSAAQLRRSLADADQRYHYKELVLVGHSMGGILSRIQVTDSNGRGVLADIVGDRAPASLERRMPGNGKLRDAVFFKPNPKVEKVVFICTPHRGSNLALIGPAGWVAGLIRLPSYVVSLAKDVGQYFTEEERRQTPTSIGGLSPNNRFLQAIARRPIQSRTFSIIGDRGRGDTPNSSDGVVPYSSSHIDGAESELIVPSDHGAFNHPMAIEELRRILLTQ